MPKTGRKSDNNTGDKELTAAMNSSAEKSRSSRSLWRSVFRCFEEVKEKESVIAPQDPEIDERKERIKKWLDKIAADVQDADLDKENAPSTQKMNSVFDENKGKCRLQTQSSVSSLFSEKTNESSMQDQNDLISKESLLDVSFKNSFFSSPLLEIKAPGIRTPSSQPPPTQSSSSAQESSKQHTNLLFGGNFNFGTFLCASGRG